MNYYEQRSEVMIAEIIKSASKLEDCLSQGNDSNFPSIHPEKTHFDRYKELEKKFKDFPVEIGALVSEVEEWIASTRKKAEELLNSEDAETDTTEFLRIFDNDPIIFLNKHEGKHTLKVQECALELLNCFENCDLNYYELYFLMCAIVVHDIGNISGRKGHEHEVKHILDTQCSSIIPDSVERRTIARIARAHGGKVGENKDTISYLFEETTINKIVIRERLLAAILRFADELADDSSRANYAAMESEAITNASLIYHIYSASLHTVRLQKNEVNNTYEVSLAYEFDTDKACTKYNKIGFEKYLVDEIYERTLKMDRERRYCIRYLRPYVPIERIKVQITITNSRDEFDYYPITYTLEENGYPAELVASIKDLDSKIKSGKELFEELYERGLCNVKG